MNQYLSAFGERFNALEKRERAALLSLAAFLAVAVLYLAIWAPVNDFAADSRVSHDRHLELLTYLRSTEADARAVARGDKRGQSADRNLLTSVARTAQLTGITPTRMQPEGSGAVSVWFDAVTFTRLMLWLERLEARQGIVVRQISIDRRNETGQVSARLVLRS